MSRLDIVAMDEYVSEITKDKLKFGIRFLDDAAGGIYKTDLVIISSHTGLGKTELSACIALENAIAGKNVYFFALEAFKYEIEARNIFKLAMNAFYLDKKFKHRFTFQDYLEGKVPKDIKIYVDDAKGQARVMSDNFHVRYIDKAGYGIDDFREDLLSIDLSADLVILDHLHFFSYDETREYSEISSIVRTIRDLCLLTNIPVILVSHLRKNNTTSKRIIPTLEDLHGSSNIQKVASKVILLAPDFQHVNQDFSNLATLFRVAKNRYNGGVQKFVGILNYDLTTSTYSDKYKLGRLDFLETEYEIIDKNYPMWSSFCI